MAPRAFPAAVAVALALAPAKANEPASETLDVLSRTFTDAQFLSGDEDGATPVALTGRLTVPESGGPQPVVILLHGSDGRLSGASYGWEAHLQDLGYGTLALDSFTGRGLLNVSFDQNVDPERIAVMGFSRGGIAALYSAMVRFRDAYGPKAGRIAAHLPFYPACNFTFARELEVGPAPIRLHHGAADDWTLPGPCRAYVNRLATAGAEATMVEHPGALHAFDNEYSDPVRHEGQAQSSRNCWREERDGTLTNRDTGAPFDYRDACVARGVSFGHDPGATAAARADVAAILADVFAAD
jgi:dienelactone hydrolase